MGSVKTTKGPWFMSVYCFTSDLDLLLLTLEMSSRGALWFAEVESLTVVGVVLAVEVGVEVEIPVGGGFGVACAGFLLLLLPFLEFLLR